MKQVFLFLLLAFPLLLPAQNMPCQPADGCRCLLEKADAILTESTPDYQQALYLYFAAQACDEALAEEAENRIVNLFDKIENLRLTAENRALLIQQQQQQLLKEKEAAELATKKAKAQNLNNLASRALLNDNLIEGFRLMQYANAYDPDNPTWLENAQEILVRNTPDYPVPDDPETKYLNLMPSKVIYPVKEIAGITSLESQNISWDNAGHITAWDNSGSIIWEKNFESPISGIQLFENNLGFVSWDRAGIIRVHEINGEVQTKFDHESEPTDVFLLENGRGYLSWSKKQIITWNANGQLIERADSMNIKQVIQKENGAGFICVMRHKFVQFWNNHGEFTHQIDIELYANEVFEINDSTILLLEATSLYIYNYQGEKLDAAFYREAFGGAVPLKYQRSFVAWGRNSSMIRTKSESHWGSDPVLGIKILENSNGFLVWREKGILQRMDLDGNVEYESVHSGSIVQMKFIRSGSEMIYSTEDGYLYHRDTETGILISKMNPQHTILGMDYISDQKEIICWTEEGEITFWEYRKIPKFSYDSSVSLEDLTALPDRSGMLKLSKDDKLQHVDWNNELIKEFQAPEEVWAFRILGDNEGVLGHAANSIFLWNLSGELITHINNTSATDCFYIPEHSLIISYKYNNGVRIWTREGELVGEIITEGELIRDVLYIPDTKAIAVLSHKGLSFWSLTGQHKSGPIELNSACFTLHYLNKNKTLLTNSQDGKLMTFDLNGQIILNRDIGIPITGLRIHPNQKEFLFWDKEGKLYRSDMKGDFRLIIDHKTKLANVTFMEDGSSFITMTESGDITCWDQYINRFGYIHFWSINESFSAIPEWHGYVNRSTKKYLIWSTSPTDILKTGNNIGIPDFTEEEKRKYGIDLNVAVDWEYLPYPWLRD